MQGEKEMKYYVNTVSNPALTLSGLNSIFNDVFGDTMRVHIPQVDIYEEDGKYTLEADVAGYADGDIDLAVEKHVLTISSKKEDLKDAKDEKKEEEKKNYLLHEIARPEFKRSFTLPEDIDEENIQAETKDGILTIVLPKVKKAQKARIEIKINK